MKQLTIALAGIALLALAACNQGGTENAATANGSADTTANASESGNEAKPADAAATNATTDAATNAAVASGDKPAEPTDEATPAEGNGAKPSE